MEVIQLATPAHFARGRVERVGLHQNRLFLAFRAERELEVWAVHCLVPCSWRRLFRQQFHELFYVHCAISAEQGALFALVAAFFENETLDGGIAIFRYQLASQQLDEFVLDPEEAPNFEEVTLERVGLSCGRAEGQLFLHDRTMVTGRIPFWSIQLRPDRSFAQMGGPSGSTPLLKMTFSIRPQHIEDEQQLCAQCTRFPVLLDGDSRTMMRITNDYQVFVHDTADGGCWQQLEASKQTALNLSSISVRGIAETFGHNWHRFSAIESKLSIFTDADCCIFKVFQHGVHHFFRFSAFLEHKTYMLEHCSAAKLDKRLETLCFVCCSASRVAFVNKHLVGFVPIQPLSLRELCFWAMQKMFANKTQGKGSSQVWSGGRTARQFQTMFNINKGLEIVD